MSSLVKMVASDSGSSNFASNLVTHSQCLKIYRTAMCRTPANYRDNDLLLKTISDILANSQNHTELNVDALLFAISKLTQDSYITEQSLQAAQSLVVSLTTVRDAMDVHVKQKNR